MDAAAGLTFRSPDLLWLLAAVPVVALFLWLRERTRQRWANRFAAERLRGVSNPIRWTRPVFLTLGLTLAVIALAGPRYGFTMRTIEFPESNRIILLDGSQSMGSEDVGTSRMDAGIAIARKIISADEGRVALVLFEGEAEVVSPLTNDRDAVITLLESFGPGELTEAGSDIGRAMRRGLELVPRPMWRSTEFVVISDGEHRGASIEEAIEAVRTAGVRVSTVLVGTTEGAEVPDGGRVLRDESGQPVISHAHSALLQQIARETGGSFYDNPFGAVSLRRLATQSGRGDDAPRTARVPLEQYQWPLGAALLMFTLGSLAHRGAEW